MATNKGYTTVSDPDTSAKALSKEQPVSPKFAREVAGLIRGMKVSDAQKTLEGVIAKEVPVPLKRYNKRVSHKQGVGPGRYPVKASKAILAASNADYKGLDSANMAISTITISRGMVIPGHRPRAQGRATQWNQETVNIEIIISEVE